MRDDLDEYFAAAERLTAITQRIGHALWQLQELEGVSATYLVMASQATRGMGRAAGEALLAKAQSKPFGVTVYALCKAHLLDAELESRFRALLAERNWLVRNSRASSRGAVRRDASEAKLIARVEAIGSEAGALLKRCGELAENHTLTNTSMTREQIDAAAAELLKAWHEGD